MKLLLFLLLFSNGGKDVIESNADDSLTNNLQTTEGMQGILELNNVPQLFMGIPIEKAKDIRMKRLEMAEALKNYSAISNFSNDLGLILTKQKEYNKALKYFNQSLTAYQKLGNEKGMAKVYIETGYLYQLRNEPLKALKQFESALVIYDRENYKKGKAFAHAFMGQCQTSINQFAEAKKHLEQAVRLFEEFGDKQEVANTYDKLGDLELASNRADFALSWYDKSLELRNNNSKLVKTTAIPLRKKARAYYSKNDLTNAYKYAEASLQVERDDKTAKLKEEIYKKMGKSEKSIITQTLSDVAALKDSLHKAQKVNEVMNYKMMQEVNKKEAELKKMIEERNEQYRQFTAKELEMARVNTEIQLEKIKKEQAFLSVSASKDSLEMISKELERQTMLLEKEKLQRDAALSEKELSLQKEANNRNILIGGLVFLGLIILFFYGRAIIKQRSLNKVNKAYTELRQTNKELVETRDKLIESEKFKQQFLANMSHEIRTPMNAVVGMTNLLLNTKLDEQQGKYLAAIKQSANNLLVIINDILDLSKIEAGKMELEKVNISLHEAVDNVWNILRFRAEEKGLDFKLEIESDVPKFVLGDETRLNQILINLAGNAIKFTEKGKVKIRVENQGDEDEIRFVKFSVIDTGIGIPADKLDRIFESFSQASSDTSRKFGGTGLGLTISKHLVELHGGDLKVSSDYGKGSTFYFTVPYQLGTEQKTKLVVDEEKLNTTRTLQILLAEDNEFNQIVAVDTLEEIFPGIQIDLAENGLIVLEKLEAKEYDLVLMDIQMPEMDGMTATKTIRETFAHPRNKMKICAMTASVTRQEVEEFFANGLDDFLAKPFEPSELKRKIIKLVNIGIAEGLSQA
jgi:signal transduction histidine kinase/uncharacterized protein HemY